MKGGTACFIAMIAHMINARQIRAARALLGLSQGELAVLAKVGTATVYRLEGAGDQVRGSAQTLWKLQTALEEAGIVFIDRGTELGLGVRLRDPSVW